MAVYTEVTDDALAAFLADYDIGSMVAFRGIAEGVENSNFSLRTTGGDFILTLYEKRVDPAELPWFLGLMEHLAKRGIVCPLPVHGRDGVALRHLSGRHAANQEQRHIAVRGKHDVVRPRMQRRAHGDGLLAASHIHASNNLALAVEFALNAVFHLAHHHHVIEAFPGQFGFGGQRGFFRRGGLERAHATTDSITPLPDAGHGTARVNRSFARWGGWVGEVVE